MRDSEIIWKYLLKFVPDEHQAVYIYTIGHVDSKETAIRKVMEATVPVFSPAMSDAVIKATVKGYLEYKKRLYKEGKINVKSIY